MELEYFFTQALFFDDNRTLLKIKYLLKHSDHTKENHEFKEIIY